MNKKKLVDKLEKMKKTAQRLIVEKPCDKLDEIQNDISNGYITAIDEVNEFIQSEPEEKTNFDVITESPQKLYKFILDQYGYSQVKEGECYYNLGRWLNEKAGE